MRHTRKSGALGLWMNGQPVGSWVVTAQGEHQLHYDETWLASPLGRPISLSMPLRPVGAPYRGERVRNYFENLLNGSAITSRICCQTTTTFDSAWPGAFQQVPKLSACSLKSAGTVSPPCSFCPLAKARQQRRASSSSRFSTNKWLNIWPAR